MSFSTRPRNNRSMRQATRIREADAQCLLIVSQLKGDVTLHRIRAEYQEQFGRVLTHSAVQLRVNKLESLSLVKRVNPEEPPGKGRPRLCYAMTTDGKREAKNVKR